MRKSGMKPTEDRTLGMKMFRMARSCTPLARVPVPPSHAGGTFPGCSLSAGLCFQWCQQTMVERHSPAALFQLGSASSGANK